MKRHWILSTAAVLGGAMLLPLTTSASQVATGDTIEFGAPVSLSGVYAASGAGLKCAYELWQDWVNDDGGLNVDGVRRQVNVSFADDRSDPNTAVQLTEDFVNDDVDFLFGPFSSDLTMGASVVSERANIIMMAGGASGSNVFNRGFENVFTTWSPTSYWARSVIDTLSEQGLERLAIIASREGAYAVMPDEAKAYAETLGIEVVALEEVDQDISDVSGPMQQIANGDPQLLMVMTNSMPLEVLVYSTAQRMDFAPTWYWSVGAYLDTAPDAFGGQENLDTLMSPVPFFPAASLEGSYFGSEEWMELFTDRCGDMTTQSVVTSFVGARVLGEAIEIAGTTDTDAVRDVLEQTEFETFMGTIAFSALDDPSGLGHVALRPMQTVQWQGGELVVVAPTDRAEADVVAFHGW